MAVRVGIIFASDDPYRIRSHKWVTEWYESHGYSVRTYAVTPWNTAEARNKASRDGCLVIADADLFPEAETLQAAVSQAQQDGLMHLPFDKYRAMSRRGTKAFYSTVVVGDIEHTYDGATAGVIVMSPDTWVGADTRFEGWGWEDTAFSYAVETLVGPLQYHPGWLTHLWHPPFKDRQSRAFRNNRALCGRYEAARGHPAIMKAILDEV